MSARAPEKIIPPPSAEETIRLLVIDDNQSVLDILYRILSHADEEASGTLDALESSLFGTVSAAAPVQPRFLVDCMHDGETACRQAARAIEQDCPYAIAFVDMRMPGGWDGLRTIEELWRSDPDLHVVICTAFSDYSWSEIIGRLGVSDRLLILRKPFEKIEVLQLASALSQKWRLHREQRQNVEALEQRVAERTRDLTAALAEREAYATQLEYHATHDILTGLANRQLLNDRLTQAISYADRYQHPIWVAFLDLDRFKLVNDTLGHAAGDQLLTVISRRLQETLRETDTVARIGGDEFVLILPGPKEGDLSMSTLERIMAVIAEPVNINGVTVACTTSIGVAAYPADDINAANLIDFADIALYRAKEVGRSNVQFFTAQMNMRQQERNRLEHALGDAIARDELVLHYQPQVDLRTGRVVGAEALIRWNHPELGMVAPARFIGLAEETGLIKPIGAWVLRTACRQARRWQDLGFAQIRVAVNLSAVQLAEPLLVEAITAMLGEEGLAPSLLEIEITESSVMANVEQAIVVLKRLKELGVQLAVDDFGTGYSSFSYLKRLPIDVLKIDRSFVCDLENHADSAIIVQAIISLAHNLRQQVIAEGVETEAQLEYLRENGCDFIQGFHFCRPLPAEQLELLLSEGRRLPN